VDRVDIDEAGRSALLIDYKTGGTSSFKGLKDDPVDAGRKLQLPIYLSAVKRDLGPDSRVRAAYWFISSTGGFDLIPPEPMELSAVADRFDETIVKIADGVGGGLFPANPGDERRGGFANCTWCDFDRLCHARRDIQWDRKKNDPRLAGYLSLGESSLGSAE